MNDLIVVGGGLGRMRLSRPRLFDGHVARWRRALLERRHRKTCHAIKHIGVALRVRCTSAIWIFTLNFTP
jgi:hypothetical protein